MAATKKRNPFTTLQMLKLYGEAHSGGWTYDKFLEQLMERAGYISSGDEKGLELAKSRFHRFRHDLKGKGVVIPSLKGAPLHRLSKDEMMAEFDFLTAVEED